MDNSFNIVNLFFEAAEKYPDKIAIIEKKQEITFSDLSGKVKITAAHFTNKGIKKGDRVLIFVPMSIDLYRVVLAVFYIGATAVFLDEWVSKKRLEECCKVAQCKAFIGVFKARIFALFSEDLRKIPIKLSKGYPKKSTTIPNVINTNETDTALITFTTGSTGTPKAAKRTHGLLNEQFKALIETIKPNQGEIDMPVLPIVLLINLGLGSTSVIADFKTGKPYLMQPVKIFKQIMKYKVSQLVSSPFFVTHLAKYLVSNNLSVPSLKKIFTGGAPVFPNEAALYKKAFPEAETVVVYGSTEAEPISSISVEQLIKEGKNNLQKGLIVGTPHHKTDVKIIQINAEAISYKNEEEFQQLILPPGKIGEIIVSGPHVLREYINNEKARRKNKIRVGNDCWHRTGDSGFLKDKLLFLTGRCDNLIKLGDSFISPFVYENQFQSIPHVEMGTIMKKDNRLIAIIETNKKAHHETIKQQINSMEICFDEIKMLSRIPRDPRHNSKIDYALLNKMLNTI